MNALELADELKSMKTGWFDDLALDQSALMLREQQRTIDGDKLLINLLYQKVEQQQARIEELEKQLDEAEQRSWYREILRKAQE